MILTRTKPLDYGKVYKTLVASTAKYMTENKMKSMVLGISGGIDSTVTAAICRTVSIETQIPLIGVSLPCWTNKTVEIKAAEVVGNEFCNIFFTEDIEDLYKASKKTFNHVIEEDEKFKEYGFKSSKLTDGNIKARIRGNFLHNLAGITGGLVMDTDNLTEHYLGFWTICGGDEGEFDPIGGLWKHEVYGLAKWIKENEYTESKGLEHSIELIPTDGNGVSQSDLDQIAPGKTYDDVDEILMKWVPLDSRIKSLVIDTNYKHGTFADLVEKHGLETVKRVIERSINSEFKRKARPFVIEIYSGTILEKNGKIID